MSREATKRTMEAFLEALGSRADFARYFAPDIVLTLTETGDTVTGREAVRDFIVTFHTVMFDGRPEFVRLVVEDGAAAAELLFTGTHTGEFAGLQPAGAAVRLPYTVFYTVTEDGITDLRLYVSPAALAAQIAAASTASASASTSARS